MCLRPDVRERREAMRMPYLPDLTEGNRSRSVVDVFGGYNHNLRINEGEWYDAENLSSSFFPIFSQRRRRGTYKADLVSPQGILAKDALAWVDGPNLYYNGLQVDGITLSTEPEDCPKQLVSMGAYLCVFPDAVYVNTADLTEFGSMAATYKSVADAYVTYTPCKLDGTAYAAEGITKSDTEPENPENGDYWLDTSSTPHALKQYSTSSGMWSQIPTVYTKISVGGIGTLFAEGDGVTISGAAYSGSDESMRAQIEALNTDVILRGVSENAVIVVGLLDQEYVQQSGSVTIERKVPKMTCVCEANNRLWGCYYGMFDGETINEIYACKLGDFKNWYCYAGLSTDSYAVSVGTDGEFTGCVNYLGYPTFFKENCIHKVYGTMPASYQVQTTLCRGVQSGSSRSLAIVNEILYYKSRTDICAYDGSLPTGISDALGTVSYYEATGGAYGGRYFASMRDEDGKWNLFVYDTVRGLWHREDDTHATGFTAWGSELYYIDADKNAIIAENGTVGALEGPVEWRADSGMIGYEMVDQGYVSRYNLRMRLGEGAQIALYLQYDSDGVWHDQGTVHGAGTDSFVLPVIPRRCDHFHLRLVGKGDIKIYSIAKIIEQGSDATWN